jgi:hypothetical protein
MTPLGKPETSCQSLTKMQQAPLKTTLPANTHRLVPPEGSRLLIVWIISSARFQHF